MNHEVDGLFTEISQLDENLDRLELDVFGAAMSLDSNVMTRNRSKVNRSVPSTHHKNEKKLLQKAQVNIDCRREKLLSRVFAQRLTHNVHQRHFDDLQYRRLDLAVIYVLFHQIFEKFLI
jgi:hypothetical protein